MTSKYLRGNRLSLNNDRNEELNLGSLAMRDDRILLRSILWRLQKLKLLGALIQSKVKALKLNLINNVVATNITVKLTVTFASK